MGIHEICMLIHLILVHAFQSDTAAKFSGDLSLTAKYHGS